MNHIILTLEPLPEDQFQEFTAGGEMRVGVRHHLSTRLQIQDTHWEVGEKQAIDSGRVVSPLLPPVYNS